jgi:hypothetical protein
MPKPSDQQISDFYVRLGLVIAAWQFVEAALVYAYGKKSHRRDKSDPAHCVVPCAN